MNMQDLTDAGHMDAVHETANQSDPKAILKDGSILYPDLIVEAWLESEIDATILEASRSDRSYDTGVKFDSEPKENQDAVAENGNNVPVLSSISDTTIPVLSDVKPETDLVVEELFEDGKKKVLPLPHENQIAVGEQCEAVLSSISDTPIPVLSDVKPETDLVAGHVPVTDVSLTDDVEDDEAFSCNATVEVQLLDNLSSQVKDIDASAVESVVNASSVSKDETLDVNSSVVDTTITINDQAAEIQTFEGETTTFHTDGMDTKHEDIIVVAENVDMPTEAVVRESEYNRVLNTEFSDEISDADYILEQDMGSESLVKKRFFLVKMPNFDDLIIRERVRQARLLVDEKTRLIDSLKLEIKKYKENCHADAVVHETIMSEASATKTAVKSTRAEIASLEAVMTRVKNALSVQGLDYKLAVTQYSIEHEELDLQERDRLIREIKQLNRFREILSPNIGDLVELQQALNNRDEIEGRLRILSKDLEGLKENYLKAEALAGAVDQRYEREFRKLKEAQDRFRAADNVRQETYKHMQSLKREMHEKNQWFHKYKVDASIAYDNAAKREIQELDILCFNQVESTMELWNENPDFRKEYVRFNMESTVERLGTFDGRLLGPDEKPFVLSDYVNQSVDGHANPTEPSNGHDAASENVEVEEDTEKLADNEAALREQRRMEEKSKALEALMRKRKFAEKAQTRAELRARKEAEMKEKEREKRLRKKERRMSTASEPSESNNSGDSSIALVYESDTPTTIGGAGAKRTIRSLKAYQQSNRAKSTIPPPALRNKGRKKLQQWIWLIVSCTVVILVFVVGNIGFFSALSDSFKGSTTGA